MLAPHLKNSDRPYFRDIKQCIYWAWYIAPLRAESIKPAAIVRLMGRDSREQQDGEVVKRASDAFMFEVMPTGYEAAAQAGMIKGYISRLPREECCHLMASYLVGRERARARRALVGIVLSYIDEGWERRPLVLRLMAKHYGQPGIFLEDLAERYKVRGGRRAVSGINREVVISLDAIGFRAEATVHDYLRDQNVIL